MRTCEKGGERIKARQNQKQQPHIGTRNLLLQKYKKNNYAPIYYH